MIAYLIRCIDKVEEVERLLETIYLPGNFYVLSVNQDTPDIKVPSYMSGQVTKIVSRTSTWGSETILLAVLEAMKVALTEGRTWDYIVCLGGEDYAVRPQQQFADYLSDQRSRGIRNFLYRQMKIEELEDLKGIEYSGRLESTLGLRPGVVLRHDVALRHYFSCYENSPIWSQRIRGSLHVSEIEAGWLLCRPLHPCEWNERKRLIKTTPFVFGSMFWVLSRETASWLAGSELADVIFRTLLNVMFPDECFVHTALSSSASGVEQGSILNDNLFFWQARPHVPVFDEHYTELKSSNAFFARKVAGQNIRERLHAEALGS